jgi:hypothetical protein
MEQQWLGGVFTPVAFALGLRDGLLVRRKRLVEIAAGALLERGRRDAILHMSPSLATLHSVAGRHSM